MWQKMKKILEMDDMCVIERAKMAQACRLLSMDSDDISKNDIATICDEDIEDVSITLREEKKQIGFTKNPL